MRAEATWVDDTNAALLTDLYQLTMLQAYWSEEMHDEAVFSLFSRHLPDSRNYLIACGMTDALRYLERLRFEQDSLDYLASLRLFSGEFLDWLGRLRFQGDVYAVPEGTPVFAQEPLLEVVAPLPQAQLVESFVMNQIHFQTVVASKAARVVDAAGDANIVDFGLRRMHGADAAVKAARACFIAGVSATSNLLAGRFYGIPVAGTMAHSYVQAHADEQAAFLAFLDLYPRSVLLVDTYDTLEAVRKIVRLAREMGSAFALSAIRLDSGDLAALATGARAILDEEGLTSVEIFASGGLDEYAIAALRASGAPIDGYGVGTRMGVSRDAPALDMAYKLTAYAGSGRLKLSPGKEILPGRKQVFRIEENGFAVRDVLGTVEESAAGRPLLQPVMRRGEILPGALVDLAAARSIARTEIGKLPARLRALTPAEPPYPVELSAALRRAADETTRRVAY